MNIKKKMSFGGIKFGFSLAEMMVVMLIVSIVLAASAPMVTRKVKRAEGKIFDAWKLDAANVAEYIRGRDQRLFMNATSNGRIGIVENDIILPNKTVFFGNRASGTTTIGIDSVGIGFNLKNPQSRTVVIGNNTQADGVDAMAVGMDARALSAGSIAIGAGDINATTDTTLKPAYANGADAIAIGRGSSASQTESVALGKAAYAQTNAVAIGARSSAMADNSIAMGNGSNSSGAKSVAIGESTSVSNVSSNYGGGADNSTSSVAIGNSASTKGFSSVAVGKSASAGANTSIAIGQGATVTDDHLSYSNASQNSIAIGNDSKVDTGSSIAIGTGAKALHPTRSGASSTSPSNSIAIGNSAQALDFSTVAIGDGAKASGNNSMAIGYLASATRENQITLGTSNSTVYIPGKLIVGGDVALGTDGPYKRIFMRGHGRHDTDTRDGWHFMYEVYGSTIGSFSKDEWGLWHIDDGKFNNDGLTRTDSELYHLKERFKGYKIILNDENDRYRYYLDTDGKLQKSLHYSDRRLKNVGKPYTAGLAELSKLTFYNFTFKKDETKTPQVGVMAQDLQKVFPNAVVKGEDGYLRIRWDEMFFAVINAVKELGTKVAQIEENLEQAINDIVDVKAKLAKQEEQIKKQELIIQAQEYKLSDLEARLEKLEKGTK